VRRGSRLFQKLPQAVERPPHAAFNSSQRQLETRCQLAVAVTAKKSFV